MSDAPLVSLLADIKTDPRAYAAWLEVGAARHAAQLMRTARQRARKSQADIAEALDVSQARISQVESGRVEDIPSLEFLTRFIAACGDRLVLTTEAALQPALDPTLLQSVDTLELSPRTAACFRQAHIVYIGDLVQLTEAKLLRIADFGRRSLNETKEVLAQKGLHLGMELPEWPATRETPAAAVVAAVPEDLDSLLEPDDEARAQPMKYHD